MGPAPSRHESGKDSNCTRKDGEEDTLAAAVPTTFYDYQPDDFPWVWAIREPSVLNWRKNALSDDEILEQDRKQNDLPVHIFGSVYLGNAFSVADIAKLKRLGITRVLNLSGPMALRRATIRAYEREGIIYKRISAQDEEHYPLLAKHWDESYAFINQDACRNGNCVIHCVAGINRSALVVTAALVITCQTPVLEAVQHVRRQRGNVALSNAYFQEQLVALARHHNLLGPPPGTPDSFLPKVVVPDPESMTIIQHRSPKNCKSLCSEL